MSRPVAIASLIWGASILLSRVVGFVREMVVSRVLGGGREADVFWTAFVLPDFLNYLLAGGALTIVFIPIFAAHLAREDEDGGWEAFSQIANFLVVLLAILLPALWWAVPSLLGIVAPGFDPESAATLTLLTRILLPAQLFHVLGGLLSAALQARDRHLLPALAPLVYTTSIIVGGLLGGREAGAFGFAWGVLAGSVLGPFGLPLLGCLRTGIRWRPVLRLGHPDLRRYLLRSLPIMAAFSIPVVDDWILRRLASFRAEGAISTLQYAKTLMRVPIGVFGLATGVATYPTVSRLLSRGFRADAFATLTGAIRRMLVLALLAQVVLTCAGRELSTILYGGRIPPAQHAAIGTALGIFGLGLWAWSAQGILARGFFAAGKTWIPPLVGTMVAAAAYPLYVFLGREHGVPGLAAASAIAITTHGVVLVLLLRREFRGQVDGFAPFFARMIPATALGIGAGLGLDALVGIPGAFVRGSVLGATSALVFLAAVLLLRVPEAHEILAPIRRAIRRRPEPDCPPGPRAG